MAQRAYLLSKFSLLAVLCFFSATASAQFKAVLEASTLNGNNGFALTGIAAGDHSGTSVGFAGDLNDDGKDDLIIGAPGASPFGAGSGSSYVLFGSANPNQGFSTLFLSGLNGVYGFALSGVAAGDASGTSVGFAGDLNDDGKDDLIIGAPGASPFGAGSGSSYVLFGSANPNQGFSTLFLSGLNRVYGFALSGVAAGDASGYSVSTIADINADGIDDLIVGAPNVSSNGAGSGAIYILFGSANPGQGFDSLFLSGLDGTTGFKMNGDAAGDGLGSSVASAGDINDDGIDDLIIGAPGASPNGVSSGSAYVLFGGTNVNQGFSDYFLSNLNGNRGFKINGAAAGDCFGTSVSFVGDINSDGVDDVIIGAPDADPFGVDSGNSYVVFGKQNQIFTDSFEE